MGYWEQLWKIGWLASLVRLIVFVQESRLVVATSECSNSFRFDQLCPDPRFGSGGNSDSGTNIGLNSHKNGVTGNPSYAPYSSSTSVKDPSTNSCDFHRRLHEDRRMQSNGIETTVITAVHVTENPWDFRHANSCHHIVKFSYDLYENSDSYAGSRSRSRGSIEKRPICEKEIGIRRNNRNYQVHSHELEEEEVINKFSVYFWHNFTLFSHSANFVDTLTNYHISNDDIACSHNPQYVQIVVVLSKNGSCEILVQQYKIEKKRDPRGCSSSAYPIPYPIQFCGSYECSQLNMILASLKLLSLTPSYNNQWSNSHLFKKNPPPPHKNPTFEHKGHVEGSPLHSTPSSSENENHVDDKQLPPCEPEKDDKTTAVVTILNHDNENEEKEEDSTPMDWREPIFLCAFPIIGVLFILFVLGILRSQTGREICRGYPYPRPATCEGSYEKESLPM